MKKLIIIAFLIYLGFFSYARWSVEKEACFIDEEWIC
jgi:hypothetical protein